MRKASMILGIVGGSLAILTAIALVLVSLFVGAVSYSKGYAADKDFDKDYIVYADEDILVSTDGCPYSAAGRGYDKYKDFDYETCPVAAKLETDGCPYSAAGRGYDKYEDCDDEACPVAAKFDSKDGWPKNDEWSKGGRWHRGGMWGGHMWERSGQDGFWKEADGKKIFVSSRFAPHDIDGSLAPRFAVGLLWFLAAVSFIGGVLGIVGGSIAKRKNTAGGVLMIVGALLASNVFAILLTGGILALVSGKKKPEDETEDKAE